MLNHRHKWISRLKKGDVLRSRSGMLRVVRHVSHNKIPGYGIRTTLIFSIQRNSWTTRPYTVYTGNDLVQMGYVKTRARRALRSKFDRTLESDFDRRGSAAECSLHSWDVLGVA